MVDRKNLKGIGRHHRYPAETRKKARDLFEAGQGCRAVAQALGMPEPTVRSWFYDWKAAVFNVQPGCRTTIPAKIKHRAFEMKAAGMGIAQISSELGIKRSTVYQLLHPSDGGTVKADGQEKPGSQHLAPEQLNAWEPVGLKAVNALILARLKAVELYQQGCDSEEIAQRLDRSVRQIRSWLHAYAKAIAD